MTRERFSLEELEAKVIADTESKNSAEVALAENLLNQYLTGFARMGRFVLSKNNEREYAWFQLATRSFGSLRCAFDVLERGYYSQAALLSRSVIEDWLVAMDAEKNNKTVEAIIKGEYEFGKAELGYGELTKRLQKFPDLWSVTQLSLSSVAYSRRQAMGATIGPDKKFLMLGQYDVKLFQTSYQLLLAAAIKMLEIVHRLVGEAGTDWWKATQAVIETANAEVARLVRKG